jgi:predicted MFS family arabinose efflux permease
LTVPREGGGVATPTETADPEANDERLLTGYEGHFTLVLAFSWLALLLGRSAVAPLLPSIVESFAITPARAGVALTVMMGAHSVMQYPAGRVSDGLTRSTVIVAGLATAVGGFALLTQATSYPLLVAGTALLGCGTGVFFSPARALLSDLYRTRLTESLGVQTTAGLSGSALAGALATAVVAVTAWQYTFLVPLVAVLVALVAVHRLTREPYRVGRVPLETVSTARRLAARADVRRLLAVTSARSFVNQAIIGFLPLFLIEAKGFGAPTANAAYALVFVVGAVVGPVVGRFADRSRPKVVITGLLAVAATGVVVLVLAGSFPVAIAGVLLVAVGMWGFPPVIQSLLLSLFDDARMGGDFGALKMVYTGVGAAGPACFGLAVGYVGYTRGLALLVGVLLVAVAVMYTVPEA